MAIKFWDYLPEYEDIRDEIVVAVDRVFRSGRLIFGQELLKFERELAAYIGVRDGIGVNSGTDALYIALAAAGVKTGDEVITVPNTAIPTVSAIVTLGARPVFVDIRDDDFLMRVENIEAAITARTKAIVPVHLFGQCVDMDPLMELATQYGIRVVEDCAQALGARYKGRRCGTIGDLSAFSFYPTKILGAYGDAGMILVNSKAAAKLARSIRNYGMEAEYYAERHGYNSRLDEIQAAILSLKLPRVEGWIARRREIAARYTAGLGNSGLRLPRQNAHNFHVYYSYVAEHPTDRDGLLNRLLKRDINCKILYPWPIHLMRAYAQLGYREGQFPIAEAKAQRIFSLPMYPQLRDEEIDEVITVLNEVI